MSSCEPRSYFHENISLTIADGVLIEKSLADEFDIDMSYIARARFQKSAQECKSY